MIKKILILLFLLLITAYLIVAVTAFNTKPADQVCKGMELIIKDSIDHGFISQKEVLRLLNGKKLSPPWARRWATSTPACWKKNSANTP